MSYNINSGWGLHGTQALHTVKPTLGKVFFVGDSATVDLDRVKQTFGIDPDGKLRYFATLDAAVSACTADRGDVILVAPGHTENVSSAGAIALDVAGVSIIGLGQGTLRPTFTLNTAATATISVSAADVSIENVVFTANFADIVAVFTTTGAKNFTLKNCVFKATATNMNFLNVVDTSTVDNAADGLKVEGCSWIEPDTATVSFLKADADVDSFVFAGNYLNLGVNASDLPAIATVATGKDLSNLRVTDNVVIRLNDANPLLITADTTTANTGVIARNFVRHADTAGELLVTAATAIGFFNNYATAVADASGYILPAVDS